MMLIQSAQNPKVKAVVKLRQQRTRHQTGLFFVESIRDIDRALAAGLVLHQLFWCPKRLPVLPCWNAVNASVRFEVTEPILAKMAYRENPEGALAVFEQRSWTWEDLRRGGGLRSEAACLWLVAVGVQKPGNLGAMVRTARAAGAHGLVVVDGVVDLWNPNTVRASTGAVFSLPVMGCDRDEVFRQFEENHLHVITSSDRASESWDQVSMIGPTALVVGAEDQGLDAHWLDPTCGFDSVSLPMAREGVDSLNASVAAGILLYEAVRQRRHAGRG